MEDFDAEATVSIEVGKARGMRSFDVDDKGRLHSVSRSFIWRPGENVAEMEKSYSHPAFKEWALIHDDDYHNCNHNCEPSPGPEMTWHGFYAFHDGSDEYRSSERVTAITENYGEVYVGPRGLRSEKAKIVALLIPSDHHILKRVGFILGYLALILLGVFVSFTPAIPMLGAIVPVWVVMTGIFIGMLTTKDFFPADKKFDKVKFAYGDNVKYFTSKKKMLKKFPLYKVEIPKPNPNDPKFWE